MFLHIGGEVIVPLREVIAIIDLETDRNSASTHEFLSIADEEGFVVSLSENPNSFIVTTNKVYLSPISAVTLKKRASEFVNS